MENKNFDFIIIGAGPAGIFAALEIAEKRPQSRVLIVDTGRAISHRACPARIDGQCKHCDPCAIVHGWAGAGAFSDGKLSLSDEVGGHVSDYIGHKRAMDYIRHADDIYLNFGASKTVHGLNNSRVDEIAYEASRNNIRLVPCPVRHLGTENAGPVLGAMHDYLVTKTNTTFLELTSAEDILCEGGKVTGVKIHQRGHEPEIVYAPYVVTAPGRGGAQWLSETVSKLGLRTQNNEVDIGVRVEVRNEVMRTVNDVLYESKLIGYPRPFKNKVRTFCQNPGGFVSQENYDGGLAVVNGHSYKERKSPNTNLAILCSQNFSHPFDQPIAYAQKVGELTNMLGDGRILVQRLGDIFDGKRTWEKELVRSNVAPTLDDAVAGDITAAMPYRAMTNILNFMLAVDEVVPGFAAQETLLYSPELKFYSNRVKMDERFLTSVCDLMCLGDSSGWTRGLMMASVMGWLAGRVVAEEL